MKPTPAAYVSSLGVTKCARAAPAATPTALDTTSAAEAPRKTLQRLPGDRPANRSVASCVLSPSSARKTVAKTTKKSFRVTSRNPSSSELGQLRAENEVYGTEH